MSDSEIFKGAVKLSPDQRDAYLAEVCGANVDLRREVDSLLRAHDNSDSVLERPAAGGPPIDDVTGDYQPITERPGTIVGPYKLMEQIGEGGFGLVFVAEQQRPVRRKVALKIVKPGMDTRDVIARFEVERQALALMDHPNIARVFDAGATESGRPYFVMELVKGISIIEYCDQQQLSPADRLELFLSVCHAIQHAHAKAIIHRDLKPSNILVSPHDGIPVVKVIDFGVAKAIGQQLTDKTVYTRFAQMIGTPLYMSPEQAEINALDVDIRSDVYSLGVLLYELLTGTTPFDSKRLATAAFDELRRIIKEEEPPKPSTRISSLGETLPTVSAQRKTEPTKLSAMVRGDLDWIVMKALEKDRTRRYETASAFGQDVRRFLDDEPIEARPPTFGYRARKFVRRNRGAVLATTGVVAATLLAVAGLAVSTAVASALYREANEAKEDLAATVEVRNEALGALRQKTKELAEMNSREKANSYSYGVALAYRSALEGDFSHAKTLLDECPEDLRQWEWHFTRRLCSIDVVQYNVPGVKSRPELMREIRGQFGTARQGSQGPWPSPALRELVRRRPVRAMFRPGKPVLAVPEPSAVAIVDAVSGDVLYRKEKEPGAARGTAPAVCEFSPDGDLLAVSLGEPAVRVLDAESGDERFALEEHTRPVTDVAFSPDGRWLASCGTDGTIRVWDVEAKTCKHTWDSGGGAIWEVFFLGGGPEQMVCVSQLDSRRLRSGFNFKIVNGEIHIAIVSQGSPADKAGLRVDDRLLEVDGMPLVNTPESRVRLRDATLGDSFVFSVERGSQRIDLTIAPVFVKDLTAGAGVIPARDVYEDLHVLDAITGKVRFTKRVVRDSVSCHGPYIAATEIRTSAKDGAQEVSQSRTGRVVVVYSENGDVVSEFEPTNFLLNANDQKTSRYHEAKNIALSVDGRKALLYGLDGLWLVDPSSGDVIKSLVEGSMIRMARFSPDGRLAAAWGLKSILLLIDVQSGQIVGRYSQPGRVVTPLASFSSDGRFLVQGETTRAGGALTVWNLTRLVSQRRGTLVARDLGEIGPFALSPTGEHFAVAVHEEDADGRRCRFLLGSVATGEVSKFEVPASRLGDASIVFSPDGKTAVFGDRTGNDAFVGVYATASAKELLRREFEGEDDRRAFKSSTCPIAATNERAMIAVGNRLLDVETGEQILQLESRSRGWSWWSLSPNGRFIASSQERGHFITNCIDGAELHADFEGANFGFSGDGHYLLVRRGGSPDFPPSVRVLDTQSGELLSIYRPRRAVDADRRFGFNGAGTRMAIFEQGASDLAVVDVPSGRELIWLPHEKPLAGAAFGPGGHRIYTASKDGTITMWNGTPQLADEVTGRSVSVAFLVAVNLGRDLATQGKFEEAVEAYGEAIDLDPEARYAWYLRGQALSELERWDEASADITRAIELGATGYNVWRGLARCHLETGKLKEYDDACRSMIAEFPEPGERSTDDWGHLGQALCRVEKFEDARRALEKVIELRGDEGPTLEMGPRWWYYAMTLYRLNETARAREVFEQLVEAMKASPPSDAESHERLRAETQEALGLGSNQS